MSSQASNPLPRLLILRCMRVAEDGPTQRQARFLAQSYEVTVMGLGENPFPQEPHIRWIEAQVTGSKIPGRDWKRRFYEKLAHYFPKLWFRHFQLTHQHRYMAHAAQMQRWDVIICNDVDTFLPGLTAKKHNRKCRIILGIRDYPTRQYDTDEPWWRTRQRWAKSVMKNFGREAKGVFTVTNSFPALLQKEFGLRQATVIYNAPELCQPDVRPIGDGRLHLVHHGVCAADRELELLIQAMASLDDHFRLHFMLTPRDAAYLQKLQDLVKDLGLTDRVDFLPHVPTRDIARTLAPYAVGVHFQPGKTFNALHAMPNKFFDFIMAGLAVVTGPYVEMGPIIQQEGIGWTTADFTHESLAETIRRLSPEAIAQAQAASRQLRLRLNAETEMAKLLALVEKPQNSSVKM